MRSLYLKEQVLEIQKYFDITGDDFNHLKNVLRVEQGDSLLLLNGLGEGLLSRIEKIEKRSMTVRGLEMALPSKHLSLDVILSVTKREALEESILVCVEAGVKNIILMETEFSQRREINWERMQSLVKSSIEQSNSFFQPQIRVESFSPSSFASYNKVIGLNILGDQSKKTQENGLQKSNKIAIFVGPEGGFSSKDLTLLNSLENFSQLEFQTPIFRAEHAVAIGIGWFISSTQSYKIG